MLTNIHPKLPMRNKAITKDFYFSVLEFQNLGTFDYGDYLMIRKDQIEIHFFKFKDLDPKENYGQVYIRVDDIDTSYNALLRKKARIHPNGYLQNKP